MSNTWGQFFLMAGLAMMVHVPLRAESTTSTEAKPVFRSAGRMAMQRAAAAPPLNVYTTATAHVIASNLPLSRVINQIRDQSGVSIQLRGQIDDKKITLINTDPRPVTEVLKAIEQSDPDLYLKQVPGGYELWDRSAYVSDAQVAKVYALESASANEVERIVRQILTPNFGTVSRADYTNKLVVYDVPEKQAEIAEVIREVDRELPVQVFSLRYASAREIAKQLENFLLVSSRQVSADDRTRQVILRAPESQIRAAAQLVETFDIFQPQPDQTP